MQWEPPIKFGEHQNLPDFPVEALPPWLKGYVSATATALQVPIDLTGMLSLGILACACGGQTSVMIKPRYYEGCNLFILVALAPGNRKSAALAAMAKPLYKWEQQQLEKSAHGKGQPARLIADDVTAPKLALLMAAENQNGSISVISAEGGVFERIACQNGIDTLLKAHASDPIRIDRVSGRV